MNIKKKKRILLLFVFVLLFFVIRACISNYKKQYILEINYLNNGTERCSYSIIGESVLQKMEDVDTWFICSGRMGWKFKGIEPGTCQIVVKLYFGGHLDRVDLYTVVVDDTLKISPKREDVTSEYEPTPGPTVYQPYPTAQIYYNPDFSVDYGLQ